MANGYGSWEDLGDTIQDIIDSAVRSQDYQKLNQTVTQAVNRAVDTGNEAVRKARAAREQYAQWNAEKMTQRPNKNVYSSKLGSYSARPAEPEKKNLPVLYRNTGTQLAGGILKTVGGSVVTLFSSVGLITSAILYSVFAEGAFLSVGTGLTVAGIGVGAWLLSSGVRTIGKLNRFEKYVKLLGRKTYCSIEQLSKMVGKPVKFVRKEIQGMIREGYFLEGHLDHEEKNLITSDETFHHYEQTQLQLAQRQAEEKKKIEQEKPTAVNAQLQEVLDRGNAFIRQIRSCNDAIPGEEISEKIFRMETIIQKIFDRAKAHPEIVPDLKKLMDYYLPMTVKLLNAYAEMDAQPIQGETIQKSKQEIEATLDTLNQAFEKLLDSVFKETAMDVSSDISVLQTLLAQEGLTDDGLSQARKQNEI